MPSYRKKPVTIQAFRWTGGPEQEHDPVWIRKAIEDGVVELVWTPAGFDEENNLTVKPSLMMEIKTLEGSMFAHPGDYIIQGVKGELYPCRADIFAETYEPVKE